MAEYSRKEFAKKCGVSSAYVTMYIKRGHIVETKYKNQYGALKTVIDDTLPINQKFIISRLDPSTKRKKEPKPKPEPKKRGPKPKEKKVLDPPVYERIVEPPKPIEKLEIQNSDEIAAQQEIYQQKKNKEDLDNEKKELEIKLLEVKLKKAQGEVLPTELVSAVFGQHFKSVTTAFYNGAENFISIIAKETGLSKVKTAKLRGELIEVVNQSVKEGVVSSKKSIKNLVQEYSEVRGVGERK